MSRMHQRMDDKRLVANSREKQSCLVRRDVMLDGMKEEDEGRGTNIFLVGKA